MYTILKSLENTSGTNAKLDILRANASNELLRTCFDLALNPRLNFYIKKLPVATKHEGSLNLMDALIRLDKLSKREVTGNAAKAFVKETLELLSAEDAYVYQRVLGRDMKCGASVGSVNKVWKDLVPTYAYMRCSLPNGSNIKKFPFKRGVYVQTKMDGMFSNNISKGGLTEILSRSGSPFPSEFGAQIRADLNELANALSENENGVNIHGELLVVDLATGKYLPRKTGNGMLNSCLQDGDFDRTKYDVHVVVWDYVPLDNWLNKKDYNVKYSERFSKLLSAIEFTGVKTIIPVKNYVAYSRKEVIAIYEMLREAGEEGAVLKSPDMIWEDTTSKDQVKLKCVFEFEVRIKRFNPGNGKNEKFFGSIGGNSEDDLLQLNASGISDDERKRLHEIRDQMIDCIMTVEANDLIIAEGSTIWKVNHPRFIEIRLDKSEANTLEEIREIYKAAQFNIFGGDE